MIVKKVFALLSVLAMLIGLLPIPAAAEKSGFEGKTVSILGDSISTYIGISNDTAANATLKGGAIYYTAGRLGVYQSDTWWQQTIDALKLKLLVNNSWSGSCILNERSGTVGAYLDRCVQLHNSSGEDPDLIAVYLGTNDFWSFPDALGTAAAIAYESLILSAEEGFTYASPKTTCEAYAIMLHKMKQRYPDAEIYCFTLLPRSNQSSSRVQQLQEFNASVKEIAQHFGVYTVDLYNDSGIKADKNFQFYVADNALHPGPAGMDAITGCFSSALLKNSRYTDGAVYDVSYDLTDVIVEQGTATAVLGGGTFTCSLTVPSNYISHVSVTMGEEDLTADCYADGTIKIDQVTGNIHITARSELAPKAPRNYRWECKDDQLVSVTAFGNTLNQLTMTQGSITDGKFTNVKCTVEEAIVLKHDLPWIMEWTSEGTWTDTTDGALLFAGSATSSTVDTPYLYRRHNSDFIAFGYASGGRYYNYGVSLSAHGIDGTARHTYRLTNRIAEDGSNMVYLSVDGQELAAMNHHWIGGTDQKKTVDWLNGRDLIFTNIGTSPHTIGNCYIDYIQVWENGHDHSYIASVTVPECSTQGYTTYRCTCGDSYVSDYVEATGNHIYENGVCIGCGKGRPTLTLQSPALEFKDMICIVAFYTAENMEDAVEMGMITYKNEVSDWCVETADHVIPGASFDASAGRYYSVSQGIHAKYLADTVYLACYAKLKDGSYVYTKLAPYSPITYATNQLANSTDQKLKQLVAAMLNYGAAAQTYFCYNQDNLANAGMTEQQRLLPEAYRADMVSAVAAVPAEKQGSFADHSGFAKRFPAVSFEGAFCIHYFFTPQYVPSEGITLYYWNEADYASANVLAAENATGCVMMEGSGTEQYRGEIKGIAAKRLSEAVYVAAVYQDSNGTLWSSGVLGYSIGVYCASQATRGGDLAELAMASAVYGYHAKQYFG